MRKPRPDAFFAVNDLTAAQALMIIKRHGLKIPEDIAVVGFTNSQIATLTDPGLTSVDQKGYEMGQVAARLLMDRIENPEKPGTEQGYHLRTCHQRIFIGKIISVGLKEIRQPAPDARPYSLWCLGKSTALCVRIMLEYKH